MKLKDGFIVRQVAGSWVAVPIGERIAEVNGLLSLNETGAFLWEILSKQDVSFENLLAYMLDEFAVDEVVARGDITLFLDSLREKGLMIE